MKRSAGNPRIVWEGEERHDAPHFSVLQTGAQHKAKRVTGIRKQSRPCLGYRPKMQSKKKKEEDNKEERNKKEDGVFETDLEKHIV